LPLCAVVRVTITGIKTYAEQGKDRDDDRYDDERRGPTEASP
jgi:hypothetical protein